MHKVTVNRLWTGRAETWLILCWRCTDELLGPLTTARSLGCGAQAGGGVGWGKAGAMTPKSP